MINVLIWGIGHQYNISKNVLSYFELTNQMKIVALVSNDVFMTKLDGYEVIKPHTICKYQWDYIFVMSKNHDEIVEEATTEYNIPREKLISYQVLNIPLLDLDKYISLKNSRISIISNNCWGGLIYKTLGLECLSPFRNLFVLQADYLKLIADLKRYMNVEPQFDCYAVDINSGKKYPVLRINDVKIHCNHEEDYTKAIEDWNRRKKRINYDNIFYEMYTENQDIAEQFSRFLGNKKRGICFCDWETSDKNMIELEVPPTKKLWEIVNANASLGAYGVKYSLVDLLQGEISLRCL